MAPMVIDTGVRELHGKLNRENGGDWSENTQNFPAVNRLMAELAKGEQSGELEGWLSVEEVEASLDI